MVCRVVCGRFEVIATLLPTSALVSVDLPVFGRPTKHTKPEWNSVMSDSSPNVHSGRRSGPFFAVRSRSASFASPRAIGRTAGSLGLGRAEQDGADADPPPMIRAALGM